MSDFPLIKARFAASHEIVQIDKRNMRGRFYNPYALSHMYGALQRADDATAKKLGASNFQEVELRSDPLALLAYKDAITEYVGGPGMIGEKLNKAIERSEKKTVAKRSR